MRLAISSQSYDKALSRGKINLFQLFKIAKEQLKLDGVEIEDKHFKSVESAHLKEIKDRTDSCGLEIVDIAFFNNYGLKTKEERDKEFENFKKWLSVSQILGLRFMRIWAGWPKSKDPVLWNEMIDCLRKSCVLAKKADIILAMENENHGGFVKDAKSTSRILNQVDSDNLRLLVDTGNYIDGITSIQKTIHLAVHVHAKFMELDEEGNEKDIDYYTIFQLLRENHYNGYVSVEYEGKEDEFIAVPRAVNCIGRHIARR